MKKLQVSVNLAWFLVIIAGIIECFWASGLKYAQSLEAYFLVIAGIALSFILSLIACRVLETSIVYAVFVGIGTAGIVMTEILFFGEEFSLAKIILIMILICAVIGLKLGSKSIGTEDSQIADKMRKDMGLDEVLQPQQGESR